MKWIASFIFLFCFVKGYFYFDKNFFKTETFRVKSVQVSGEYDVVKKEILKSSEHLKNKYIWDIDTDKIEEFLKKDIRIQKVDIIKKIPNTIIISIQSKPIKYYVSYESEILGVSEDMQIISYLNDYPREDLPILTIKNIEEIQTLTGILNKIQGNKIEKMISQIYLINKNKIEITLMDGIKIITNEYVKLEKYQLAGQLYLNLKDQNSLEGKVSEYIDIRFSDYIVK